MLRIVVDTNVLVSAIIRPGSAPEAMLRRWQAREFELVTCQRAIDELDDVLRRPHIATKYAISDEKRETLLDVMWERVLLVTGDSLTGVVPNDPKDDMFVACAVEGDAKYIVSGDKHLLRLKRYGTVRVIPAAYFLRVLNRCQRRFGKAG